MPRTGPQALAVATLAMAAAAAAGAGVLIALLAGGGVDSAGVNVGGTVAALAVGAACGGLVGAVYGRGRGERGRRRRSSMQA